MKYFLFLLFISLSFVFTRPSAGQSLRTYCDNLNIENGMPDNHIYRMIADRFGYLWIGTPRGVVRYNGYDYKTFTLDDNLANDDVWDLHEDKKGKIWLGCISSELGYLYNNRYYKTHPGNTREPLIPDNITANNEGDIFFTSGFLNRSYDVYMVHNDTVSHCGYRGTDVNTTTFQNSTRYTSTMPSGYVAVQCDKKLYAATLPKDLKDTFVTLRYIGKVPALSKGQHAQIHRLIGDYSLFVSDKAGTIGALNVRTGVLAEINLSKYGINEKIHDIYPDTHDSYFYAICDNTLIKFDPQLNFLRKYNISDLIQTDGVDGSKIHTIVQNNFWKNCIGTTTDGVYVNNDVVNHFKRSIIDLRGFEYIGDLSDSVSIWWNGSTKKLAKVTWTNKVEQIAVTNTYRLNSAVVLKNGVCLLAGIGLYSLKNKEVIPLGGNISELIYDFRQTTNGNLILATNRGLLEASITGNHHILLEPDRYKHVLRDSFTGDYWAYNNDKIFIYRAGGASKKMALDDLKKLGIKRIDKIAVDNIFGNIFIKSHDGVLLYVKESSSFRKLFDDYNMDAALVQIQGNTLVIAGRFGVLFCKINGKNSLTQAMLYSNLRDINYRQVLDMVIRNSKILLQTDKGTYELEIPADSAIKNAVPLKNDLYRFVLNYRDTIRSLKSNDTLIVNQLDKKIAFDIINPNGNGRIRYLYRVTGNRAWYPLNANEITLPTWFAPDKYYDIYILAQDNAWKSSPLKLTIYIHPYWWQTTLGRRSLWAAVVLFILILLVSAILITRRLVLSATQKRHLRMELELKAIYSQINPHFIFNTLNSALLLVSKNKMEDAYAHISKFSRLLRSYIKSSRNKYISVADEIDNLEDYVELQQTRFKNKFTYEIIVDPAINQEKVKIPALLLQPFVENAINHGILPKEQQSHLKIEFRKDEQKDEISCIVEDDGVGRKYHQQQAASQDQKMDKDSYGNLLIKDLVSIFNRYEHMNITIKYVDKAEPLTGTIVYIKIKNPHHGQ